MVICIKFSYLEEDTVMLLCDLNRNQRFCGYLAQLREWKIWMVLWILTQWWLGKLDNNFVLLLLF